MDEDEAADCLYNTVLAKIVKSQVWMKETGTLPHDFVIFCWLPPVGAYRACLENTDALLWTEALLWNVRAGGWPFSLVVRVPEQPGRVFPRNFGFRNYRKEQHNPAAELSYFLNPTDFEDDDDEMLFGWDVFVEEEDATVIEEEDVQVLALVRRAIALIERANLAEAAPAEQASDNLSEGAQRNHAADLASGFRIHYARCRELFADLDFKKEYGLGAVNSINWARIMFQITYYFYTYFKLFPNCDGEITFSVPTGNFGDILAGYYARMMGLPVKNLIVATNSNDILHRFFTTGKYDKYPVKQTMSPSMDIGISSNFERYLFDIFNQDAARLSKAMTDFKSNGKLHVEGEELKRAQKDFLSACATEQHQKDTIREYQSKFNYTLCPHTACGISAAEQLRESLKWASVPNHAMVVLGTAHPGKFADHVAGATGVPVKLPPDLDALMTAKTRFQVLGNSASEVRKAIEEGVQGTSMMPSLLSFLRSKLPCY
ncbi:unnamed protein product [Effrenium voratum]|nr:unnamed protein product [Effrenium voratum]